MTAVATDASLALEHHDPSAAGLLASNIRIAFGGLVALDQVTMGASRNQITGLLGPNGAGKTMFFDVCCGFHTPDTGTVTLGGVDITKYGPAHRARSGLGRTFQRMEIFHSLTVRENVEFAAECHHITGEPLTQLGIVKGGRARRAAVREKAAALIDLVGLNRFAEVNAGELSTGQGRLVELARALARDPDVLLLDEPSSGLDADETIAFGETLQRIVAETAMGILIVEHDMSLVLKICTLIHFLEFGKHIMSGTPAEIVASEEVRRAYLGATV
jgi:ABC-type branched-subunit amino acid transport system ATPase component